MGACLSKKSGKKGEDPDRIPYQPSNTSKGKPGKGKEKEKEKEEVEVEVPAEESPVLNGNQQDKPAAADLTPAGQESQGPVSEEDKEDEPKEPTVKPLEAPVVSTPPKRDSGLKDKKVPDVPRISPDVSRVSLEGLKKSPRRDSPTLGPSSTPPPESEPPPKPSPKGLQGTPVKNEYDQPVAPGQVRVNIEERPKDLPKETTREVCPYAVSELTNGVKTPTTPEPLPPKEGSKNGTRGDIFAPVGSKKTPSPSSRVPFSSFKPFATESPIQGSITTKTTVIKTVDQNDNSTASLLMSPTSPAGPLPTEPITRESTTFTSVTTKTETKAEVKSESSPEDTMAIFSALKYLKTDSPTHKAEEEKVIPEPPKSKPPYEADDITETESPPEDTIEAKQTKVLQSLFPQGRQGFSSLLDKNQDLVRTEEEQTREQAINGGSMIEQKKQVREQAPDGSYSRITTVTRVVSSSTQETPDVTYNGHITGISEGITSSVVTPPESPEKGRPHVDAKVVIQPQTGNEDLPAGPPEPEPVESDEEDYEDSSPEEDQEDTGPDEPVMLANLKNAIKTLLFDFKTANDTFISGHKVCAGTRVKQLQTIDRWLTGTEGDREADNQSRIMVLTGAPGMGKTSITAEVCRKHAARLAGCHFFCYNQPNLDHNSLRSVIMSLAHRFSDTFSNYPSMLPRLDKLRDTIMQGDVPELFDMLLFNPLNSMELKHDEDKHMLIVIDALDECDLEDHELLLEIIRSMREGAPEWLYLLISCRNDNQMLTTLENIPVLELKKSNENSLDIKRYFKEPMGRFMDRISLDGGLTQLAKRSDGLFLCASLMRKHLDGLPDGKKIALREVEHMFPQGINGLLTEIFSRFRDALSNVLPSKDVNNAYKVVLSILTAAQEPISLEYISSVLTKDAQAVKDCLMQLSDLLVIRDNLISFCHKYIPDWLAEPQDSAACAIDIAVGREQLAALCVRWLAGITDDDQNQQETSSDLRSYALKHSVHHLTDVSRQHENIGKVLCNLSVIQSKLQVPGVYISHVLDDYSHQHVSISRGAIRPVSLEDYMKKHPQTMEHIASYKKFLIDTEEELKQNPSFLLQIAANYTNLDRIKQNARVELEGKPWIEDVTSVPETKGIVRSLVGSIKALDVSPDGKTVAIVCKDEDYNVRLHLFNTHSGEPKIQAVDIKSLGDRVGLQAKFLPDGNNVFVGSLTTFISSKGKMTPSGFDVKNIELKEKFSIECCDVSSRYFACGLNTFPWGGRSLHMCVFDMRTKKPLKVIEVLHFRFGGSAQFGIKACAVAKDKPYLCACVRQSSKNQLRIIVWNVTKWQVLNSIDVNNEDITKCLFVGDQTLLLGSGVRTGQTAKTNSFIPIASESWDFKEVSNKNSKLWDQKEMCSVFCGQGDKTVSCRWYKNSDEAVVSLWNSTKVQGKPDASYRLRGLQEVTEMVMGGGQNLVFVSQEEMYIYNTEDLEKLDNGDNNVGPPPLSELSIDSLVFLPRSDTLAIVNKEEHEGRLSYSVYMCDPQQEEITLSSTPFTKEVRKHGRSGDCLGQYQCFKGAVDSSGVCFPNSDGNYMIFNAGDHLKIWDRSTSSIRSIPSYADLKEKFEEFEAYKGIKGIASPKENILAVVYGQIPFRIYLYDIKTGKLIKKLDPKGSSKKNAVSDMMFLPSNGHLVVYYRDMNHSVTVWSPRSGDLINSASHRVSYARVSPSSDRLAISIQKHKKEGSLLLRNSENKFSSLLAVPNVWLVSQEESDVEFALDGTILVGVCAKSGICQVWNAANGEVLQDLSLDFKSKIDVVGMLTNTHVLFHGDCLVVMDVAPGEVVAVLPTNEKVIRKTSRGGGLQLSSRGGAIAGITHSGRLSIFICHNFATVKRKTTLQRMKSFQK